MKAIVVAPGESLTAEDCAHLYSANADCMIAVSDAFRLLPHIDALVSNDRAWWDARPEARSRICRKFSTRKMEGIEQIQTNDFVSNGSSSGVLAMWVARELGAKKILMVGFDNQGSHFFGAHTGNLKNTTESRYKAFQHQFEHLWSRFRMDGIDVRNATPGTALKVFPILSLDEGIEWLSLSKLAA
jgi:hypothetical protein